MKEVFISYSTVDTAPAETVRGILENNGISCWMAPRDIPGGSNYTKEIPIAIRNCRVFLLILSENAQKSPWVLKELDSAVNGAKVIIPFMLEDCVLNDEFNFLLSGAQRYSAYQKKAEAMEKLIARIRAILGADGQAPAEAPQPEPETVVTPSPKPAAPVNIFGEAVCPACGSTEVTRLPKKMKRQGAFEWLMLLLIAPFVSLGFFAATILSAFLYWYIPDGVMLLIWLVLPVGCGFLGNLLGRKIIRRHRLRQRTMVTCCRCKRCDKVFNHTEALDN